MKQSCVQFHSDGGVDRVLVERYSRRGPREHLHMFLFRLSTDMSGQLYSAAISWWTPACVLSLTTWILSLILSTATLTYYLPIRIHVGEDTHSWSYTYTWANSGEMTTSYEIVVASSEYPQQAAITAWQDVGNVGIPTMHLLLRPRRKSKEEILRVYWIPRRLLIQTPWWGLPKDGKYRSPEIHGTNYE